MVMNNYGMSGPAGNSPDDSGAPIVSLVPISDLSIEARRAYRRDAVDRGLRRAAEKKIINSDYSNAIVRELRPDSDLNFGAVTFNQWLTTALIAGTLNTLVNNTQLPVNQLIVIYGVSHHEASPSLGEFQFDRGTGGGGGIIEIVNVEPYLNRLENEFYLTRAIAYDPADIIFIQAMPYQSNANGERWQLHGYVFEPIGVTLPAPIF